MRLPDWETRLAAHFAAIHARTFAWGYFDCALAVCDGIEAVTGENPGSAYRGKYFSAAEADKLVGPDLGRFAASLAAQLKFQDWTQPTFARRGDVVLVDNGDPRHGLATVDLSGRFAWCVREKGCVRLPMRCWLRAWQIG